MAATDFGLTGRTVEVEAPDSAIAHVDADSMRRVLDNLIDNAHKYGAAPIRVVVAAELDRIVLSVLDDGPGVPEPVRERIFERFSRLDRDQNKPGIGLGLPICRALVHGSGGEIRVGSSPSGGAAFVVTLPRESTSGPFG
jgi:two-component system sensor histidine kinase KdpD